MLQLVAEFLPSQNNVNIHIHHIPRTSRQVGAKFVEAILAIHVLYDMMRFEKDAVSIFGGVITCLDFVTIQMGMLLMFNKI